jgi:hypothetical protein
MTASATAAGSRQYTVRSTQAAPVRQFPRARSAVGAPSARGCAKRGIGRPGVDGRFLARRWRTRFSGGAKVGDRQLAERPASTRPSDGRTCERADRQTDAQNNCGAPPHRGRNLARTSGTCCSAGPPWSADFSDRLHLSERFRSRTVDGSFGSTASCEFDVLASSTTGVG